MMIDPSSSSAPESVRHYVPGGREHGGGIGRLIGYIVDAQPAPGRHLVQDTRGPRWRAGPSSLMLLLAILALLRDRALRPSRLHHVHIAGRGSTARKLILTAVARAVGARHLLHLHDFDYAADHLSRPQWRQAAVRRMFQGADRVIVLGRRDRDTVRDILGVEPDRISILHNCVPDPGPHGRRIGADRPMRILFLGQLGPRKGVPELLAALAHPAMAGRSWFATLAGDGPAADYFEQARGLGLAGRIDLPGWLSEGEVAALCADADILVLPSHGEGFAMAVLEGLAHGLCVVTTRVGAHEELLEHERTCLFVPVGDADALALALARLADDPAERERLGRAGRALFLSTLDITTYVRRLDALQSFPRHDAALAQGAA